jgi:hypothetical protein
MHRFGRILGKVAEDRAALDAALSSGRSVRPGCSARRGVSVPIRVLAAVQAVGKGAAIRLCTSPDHHDLMLLHHRRGDQVLERRSLPAARFWDEADQRPQEFERMAGLIPDRPRDSRMSRSVSVRMQFRAPFHSRLRACASEASSASLRMARVASASVARHDPPRDARSGAIGGGKDTKSTKGALVHMDNQPMALLCRGRDGAVAVP